LLKLVKLQIFLIIIVMFILSSCSSDNRVLATYNNDKITFSEFNRYFNVLDEDTQATYNNNYDSYYNLLLKLGVQKILTHMAEAEKITEETELQNQLKEIGQQIAYGLLQKRNITDKINISQSDFNVYRKQYILYQIVKRTDTLNQNLIDTNKNLLNRIRTQISTLDDFKRLAREHSDDITATNGGFIGRVRPGEMEDSIDQVLKNLQIGECSNIIESQVGLHLIFIADTVDIPIDELKDDPELNEIIYNTKFIEAEETWYRSLLNTNNITIYQDNIFQRLRDNAPAIKYKDTIIDRKTFFETADNLTRNLSINPTNNELLSLANNMGLELILSNLTSNESIQNSGAYKKIMEFTYYDIVSKYYTEKMITIEEPTEDDLKRFYNENIDNMFTFELQGGTIFVQPYSEVVELITLRVKETNRTEMRNRFLLSVINDNNFEINENNLKRFITETTGK